MFRPLPSIEIWKEVPGTYGELFVSNKGRVAYSDGDVLKPHIKKHRGGYLDVYPYIQKIEYTFRVHTLVMLAFRGIRPEGYHINHKNGIKSDNRLSNLEYCTPQENIDHAIKLGLRSSRGEKNVKAKLTREQVEWARKNKHLGCTQIGKILKITKATASKLLLGRTWNDA